MDCQSLKERRQSDSSQVPGMTCPVCGLCARRNGTRITQTAIKLRFLCMACKIAGRQYTWYLPFEYDIIKAERKRKERERTRSLRLFIRMFPELDHTNGYVQKW